jgi:hypothetical protein
MVSGAKVRFYPLLSALSASKANSVPFFKKQRQPSLLMSH